MLPRNIRLLNTLRIKTAFAQLKINAGYKKAERVWLQQFEADIASDNCLKIKIY